MRHRTRLTLTEFGADALRTLRIDRIHDKILRLPINAERQSHMLTPVINLTQHGVPRVLQMHLISEERNAKKSALH